MTERRYDIGRRGVMGSGGALAAAPLGCDCAPTGCTVDALAKR